MSNHYDSSSSGSVSILYPIIGVFTAIVGHSIHHSIFWAIVDWFFWPIAWCKWLLCHEVSLSVIKNAFSFFLQ